MEYHGTGQIFPAYFIPNLHIGFSVKWIWVFRFIFSIWFKKKKDSILKQA